MPLLPNIPSDYVYKGWWRNLTAPPYRQLLWTTTNTKSVLFLGLLGILGTIAGNRLWPIVRHFLQPGVQLSDSENRRVKVSRTDAIKSLWAEMKDVSECLKIIWSEEHGIKQNVKMSLAAMAGNYRQISRPMDTNVELRFGVFAILNIVSFSFLGIFIPFFLADGIQGETIVQAIENFRSSPYLRGIDPIIDQTIRRRVNQDFKTCVTDNGVWIQTGYCLNLRNSLPPYKIEDMNLTDPIFSEAPYRFLIEKGDKNFKALKLTRIITLRDIAFNTRHGGKELLHELTCVPASLGQFITQLNGSFQLRVKDLIPSVLISRAPDPALLIIHDSMILKTSNAFGSGQQYSQRNVQPVTSTHDSQEAAWYQTDVDSTLPWIESSEPQHATELRVGTAAAMVTGLRHLPGSRLRNFFITFKPGQSRVLPGGPSDDPIFEAHQSKLSNDGYVANRELSALGCAEIFKICVAGRCTESPPNENEGVLEESCPLLMSVWLSSMVDPTYTTSPHEGRDFFGTGPNHRQRWQDDVEERFIRSILKVRHAFKFSAEQDLVRDSRNTIDFQDPEPLLYVNSDHTDINVWGSLATAGGYLYIIAASYWLVLLSPLILPLNFFVRGVCITSKKLKVVLSLCGIWIYLAGNAIRNFVGAINWLESPPHASSNTLSMDTLNLPQESDEPDNPPRMAGNHGSGERS